MLCRPLLQLLGHADFPNVRGHWSLSEILSCASCLILRTFHLAAMYVANQKKLDRLNNRPDGQEIGKADKVIFKIFYLLMRIPERVSKWAARKVP